MTDTTPQPHVTRNDELHRYEIHVGDNLAGFAEFRPRKGEIVFTHTETLPAFAGQGLGLALVKDALADAVAQGEVIVPVCPFVRRYLERNDVPGATVRLPDQS